MKAIDVIVPWLREQISTRGYGEAHIVVKVHDGEAVRVERSFTEKIQIADPRRSGHDGNRR